MHSQPRALARRRITCVSIGLVGLAVVVAAFFLAITASASAERALGVVKFFRTPSGNIGCVYAFAGPGVLQRPSLRCDIRSGIRPKPARPKNCDLDWGDSYELGKTGRAIVVCHGDTAIDPHAQVVPYGTIWHAGLFTCSSAAVGLRCRNGSGHGFFLSRGHSYRF